MIEIADLTNASSIWEEYPGDAAGGVGGLAGGHAGTEAGAQLDVHRCRTGATLARLRLRREAAVGLDVHAGELAAVVHVAGRGHRDAVLHAAAAERVAAPERQLQRHAAVRIRA